MQVDNCVMVDVLICGWPFPFMFTRRAIKLGEDVRCARQLTQLTYLTLSLVLLPLYQTKVSRDRLYYTNIH